MDRDFNLLKSCSCCLLLHSLEKRVLCVCVFFFLISWETTISKSCSHGDLTAHSHVYTRDGKVDQSSKVLTKSANKGVTILCCHLGYKCKHQPSLYTRY